MMKKKRHGQMSESIPVGIILAIVGGYLDAYTYNARGHVFANAQTGNMVLLGQNLSQGQWMEGIQYLIPILAFAAGIYIVEKIKERFQKNTQIHWRQIIVLIEIILLLVVGFLPQTLNLLANVSVSFVCAVQVESFRKVKGNAYATTMCTGNLRSATELFCAYRQTKNPELKKRSLQYYGIILVFILGAILGVVMTRIFHDRAVLFCCIFLAAGFLVMFIKEDIEGEEAS